MQVLSWNVAAEETRGCWQLRRERACNSGAGCMNNGATYTDVERHTWQVHTYDVQLMGLCQTMPEVMSGTRHT